ncbi:hypothetical protein GLS40_09120 [Pseudooceanicola sp. 216_PA32_1]|uniref:HTH luxR-type domain-containing protein n=1 Tax=Pseudooceanicola pacificus TaxID=2676438 RepID=A0A844WAV6_9RHOB|nr:LuxR C-terminal-related transcriptional regulator [Pseudooceanicola pacificus]MWB78183.1 hypothetical protein [Pseudooceanicola pacificus]
MNKQTTSDFDSAATFAVPVDLIDIISNIGTLNFPDSLLEVVHRLVGVDFVACYRLSDYRLLEVASAASPECRLSRAMRANVHEVKRHLATAGDSVRIRVIQPITSVAGAGRPSSAEDDCETVLVYARLNTAGICMKLLRRAGREALDADRMPELERVAALLLTIISRHTELFEQKSDLTPALASREMIEDCVVNMSKLSRREREVCSRILHGLSSCAIADDLGIGKESVMTYRKRAYSRLGIASQRELLMWYLDAWNAWVNTGMRSGEAEAEAA